LGGNGQPGVINQLAQGFAARVNTILTGATTSSASGTPNGSALFTYDTTDPTDVARTLNAASLTPDQSGVATTGSTGTANGAALLLSNLSSSNSPADHNRRIFSGNIVSQTAAGLVRNWRRQIQIRANSRRFSHLHRIRRQQSIGVSDAEAIAITADQRAYQASAQVISVLNQLTQTEVDLIK
jgi:flagellar hook-associated protein FlgK